VREFMLLYFSFISFPGTLQMNYEDFCHIATVCTEQIGQKCKRFFSPSNFMKFEKDDSGRIAILPFYLYVMRTVSSFSNL
jgi:serine/threonine-protein phosphatase 2A regulatory subunit B''